MNLDISSIIIPAVVGSAVTFIVSIVTQYNWPRWAKVLTAVLLTAGVTSAVLLIFFDPQTWELIVAWAGFAFGVGQIVYQLLKPTGLFTWLEESTSVAKRAVTPGDDTGAE